MFLRNDRGPSLRPNRKSVVEFALVTATLVGLYLWQRIITAVFGSPPASSGFLAGALSTGGPFVAGLVLFTGAYTCFRDIEVGLSLPSRADLPSVVLAGVAPVVLVALTKLVGTLSDVPYNSLTMTSYAADAPLLPILLVAGIGVAVGVPSLVMVCQALVQGSFERVVGGDDAVVLTTLVTGFVMMGHSGLTTVPSAGKIAGTVLFVLLLGVALYAAERVDRRRVRALAYVPVLLFGALVVLSGIAEIESVAEGMFTATHLAVLAIAAHTYERTNSLLVPALGYTSLLLANGAVVVVFEAGMRSW